MSGRVVIDSTGNREPHLIIRGFNDLGNIELAKIDAWKPKGEVRPYADSSVAQRMADRSRLHANPAWATVLGSMARVVA